MKVAQVVFRFDAPGGVETNVREVSRRLREESVDVEVFSGDLYDEQGWVPRTSRPSVVDGIPVHWFPVYKRLIPGLTLPLMPGLMEALANSAPDVIHAHSHRYGHVLEAAAVAHQLGIPLVVSTHYHPALTSQSAWKRGMLRFQDYLFGGTAYRVARTLIVESDLEAQLVRDFAPTRRIQVIPPGISLADWSTTDGRPVPFGLPPRYLLFVGRIAPNKGLRNLLSALASLPSGQRLPLVLMGKDWGEREKLLLQANRLGLTGSTYFLSHVEDAVTYRAVVRNATVFVLPSEWEAFGLVLLESMASGVPTVATSVGGVPELLESGESGWLVPPGDSVALAGALVAASTPSPETAAKVRRARERVKAFDWSAAVGRHLDVYRSLAH